jgi:hypothetical protein
MMLSHRGYFTSILHSRCLESPPVYFRQPPNFPDCKEVLKACCFSYPSPGQLISISFVKEATDFHLNSSEKLRNCVKFKQKLHENNCRALTYTAYVIGLKNPRSESLVAAFIHPNVSELLKICPC